MTYYCNICGDEIGEETYYMFFQKYDSEYRKMIDIDYFRICENCFTDKLHDLQHKRQNLKNV